MSTAPPATRALRTLLWLGALVLTFATASYQRRTGPTYPFRGEVAVGGETLRYRLVRSAETTRDARVALPAPRAPVEARLLYRRLGTGEEFSALPLTAETRDGRRELAAYLPRQPAAGKLEYALELGGAGGASRIPAEPDATVVIRFKGPVSTPLLAAHVTAMVVGLFAGLRAGLGALWAPAGLRRLTTAALAALTLGGMLLGPLVQKQAFGAYWTGYPWGRDLTDNKTLLMWLAWVVAAAVVARARDGGAAARAAVFGAALAMTAVYLVPHSWRGSELDYRALERGVPAADAVRTGG